jgi:hypothetical protein
MYYTAGFHRFVSTLLFTFFQAKDKAAEDFFQDFTTWARDGSMTALERIFPSEGLVVQRHTNPLHSIATFATLHRETIREELRRYHQNQTTPNWIPDLTSTSIFSVLCAWGELLGRSHARRGTARDRSGRTRPVVGGILGRRVEGVVGWWRRAGSGE